MHNFIASKFAFYLCNFTFCSYAFLIEIISYNAFQYSIVDCCKPVVNVFTMILLFCFNI